MNLISLGLSALLISSLTSCGKTNSESREKPAQSNPESFHADNDIAMTIRSIADAIKVGEPLDSTDYDFRGVLTDGQGTPLYTDIDGIPGIWDIDVLDSGKALIKNLYLGDLLPKDLEIYILESLNINENQKIPSMPDSLEKANLTFVSVYDIAGGYLRYEVRPDTAPNGLTGSHVTITLGVTPLLADGKQTAV